LGAGGCEDPYDQSPEEHSIEDLEAEWWARCVCGRERFFTKQTHSTVETKHVCRAGGHASGEVMEER